MKTWIFTLSCLMLLNACGPLTPEQWDKLNGTSKAANQQSNSSTIQTLQGDFRGSQDLQYTVTPNSTSNLTSFNIQVSRANGLQVTRTVALGSDQNGLFQMVSGIFKGSVTIQSRTQCSQCTSWGVLTTNRSDASSQQFNYPSLVNTTVTNPVDQLNQYILNRL